MIDESVAHSAHPNPEDLHGIRSTYLPQHLGSCGDLAHVAAVALRVLTETASTAGRPDYGEAYRAYMQVVREEEARIGRQLKPSELENLTTAFYAPYRRYEWDRIKPKA